MKFKVSIVLLFLILMVSALLKVAFLYYVFFFIIFLFSLILGVVNIQWNYFISAVHSLNQKKSIALTFDDGPHPEYTPLVLDVLKKHNIKAVFFCVGKNAERYPELVKRIYEEGHLIGNHTFTHSHSIDFKLARQWAEEITKTDEILMSITQEKPSLFRPPFGITTPHLAEALHKTKHKTIGWTVRPYDTVEQPVKKIINKITKAEEGDIILLHDTHSKVITVLETIIPYFQSKKYKFLTI